jgi:integrase
MRNQQTLDQKIAQVNQRLKIAQLGLQIERRGQKLSLRGTFPPRPDSGRLRPYQQRLSLGLSATPDGLKLAEQQAKIVAAQLLQSTFDWADYRIFGDGGRLYQMDIAEKLDAFKIQFFKENRDRGNQSSARSTWETAYAPYMRKLEAIAHSHSKLSLTEAIYQTVQTTAPNSRSRQVCCTAMSALAAFLNISLPPDWKSLSGNYSPSKTKARRLPSDDEIIAAYWQIPNPSWQFVYGIMATYGLRNHEVFFCDFSTLINGETPATIEVLKTTKTGQHEVWPFLPEWVEKFNLREINLPHITTDLSQTTLQRIGQQVSCQFRRYQVPFSPYDLRHAWAVRTIHIGLPDTIAARMMGHSVAIHTRTYHRWLAHRDQQHAVDAALRRYALTETS